jgi:PAB1-binding protein PBP1
MAYKTRLGAIRYNNRMDKIWETYKKQEREKQLIAKEIYKTDFEKLSEERKRNIDHIWGDRHGI